MPTPSAYFVREAIGIPNEKDAPGELYFSRNPDFMEDVPADQEAAKQQFEQFAMVLRMVFQSPEPELFNAYFDRLLSTARAAFEPRQYFPAPLNDLAIFKNEVVQAAGSRIKARYTSKLAWAVLWASLALGGAGVAMQGIVSKWAVDKAPAVEAAPLAPAREQMPTAIPAKSVTLLGVQWSAQFSFAHAGILAAAAMWGLLFASMTRNIDPTFDTLLTPDNDLMEPWVRLLFFGIPTLIIALIFQTQLVSISFGTHVSTSQINDNAIVAALIGFLLGIAERALPNEVEQWSKKLLTSSHAV